MKSKLALLLATLLLFNIILPTKVFASSVPDQSKPIFGLTADQVVDKYNQLSDQQKDQVLRSLGNTSIFANSLFGNIFNSTFGALDDAVKKLGDLFFQANGVVYKLGSSALAWVSRLIDKVFNNNVLDLNISQPVIDDLYINTKGLYFTSQPLFINGSIPSLVPNEYKPFVPSVSSVPYKNLSFTDNGWRLLSLNNSLNSTLKLIVDKDSSKVGFGNISLSSYGGSDLVYQASVPSFYTGYNYSNLYRNIFYNGQGSWSLVSDSYNFPSLNFTGSDYISGLKSFLTTYVYTVDCYWLYSNGFCTKVTVDHLPSSLCVTNNTYYNYIYNVPDLTPLNVINIVSNTAINYDPVENIIQYLPDNYNIEQNFSVVNNYYISSGSAITGQAIDVNIVSPGVIDVRIINPEDISQEVTNNISKDLILNFDLDYGDLFLEPKLEVNLNQNLNSIKPEVTSSGGIVSGFAGGIPPDLFKIITVLVGISFLVACLYHGSN